jgi:SAM-dependent methyltransferase
MKRTTERHSPERVRTAEERVIDAMHRYAYEVVREYARPIDRLLEVGFGEGYGSDIVRASVAEYVGLEVDPEAVRHAAARYGGSGSAFLVYDGRTIPFDEASFDLVVSFQVLEHVEDTGRFLGETRRVTRPGGQVLIVTPNRNYRLEEGERPWNRYHVREFNPAELEAAMRRSFAEVALLGICGSATMNEIERNRVARARRLARLDPLGVRYRLPESFDTKLRTLLRRRAGARADAATDEVGIQYMHRSREGVDSSLQLLAVGRA